MPLYGGARILIASRDRSLREQVQQAFGAEGYDVTIARDVKEAYRRVAESGVDVAIIDSELLQSGGFTLSRRLREEFSDGQLAILILIDGDDTARKIRVFEAGADNYLTRPFDREQWFKKIEELLAQTRPAVLDRSHPHQRGRIIAFFGSKAGVGSTTLAVNCAVALHDRLKGRVVLVDADFSFGDIAIYLNLPTSHDIIDLIRNIKELDRTLIEQVLVRHESGLQVLLNPPEPEQADLIAPEHVEIILASLAQLYGYVVVNCYTNYDARTLAILEQADDVMLITTPEISSIRNASSFLHLAERIALDQNKIQLVLNRSNSNVQIKPEEIEKTLQRKIQFRVISSGQQVVLSLTQGVPLVSERPSHRFSQQIYRIADSFIGRTTASHTPEQPPHEPRSLFDRLLPRYKNATVDA